jgi:fatty acid desaturase
MISVSALSTPEFTGVPQRQWQVGAERQVGSAGDAGAVHLAHSSDAMGWWALASTWAVIGAAFAVLARWPNPLTFLLAVAVIGGRQLALAIAMHEAAHRSLFRTRVLNDVAADWLCARPIWNDVARYRRHHLEHHAYAGTDRDPDVSLIDPFPVTRSSLVRKLARDLFGISGIRRVLALALTDLEVLEYTVAAVAVHRPRAGLLARLTVAPLRVNYHMEHHLLVSVPYFRLPEMHRMVRERTGDRGGVPGYWHVLRTVSMRVS